MGFMDKVMFWKADPISSSQSTPPDYDLGAKSFDNPLGQPTGNEFGSHQMQGLHNPDPLGHDPMSSSIDPYAGSQHESGQQFGYQNQQYPQAQPFPGSQQYMQQNSTQQYPQAQQGHEASKDIHPRDVELILAKLDGIKSELDSLHQRVRKIEQYYDAAQQQAQPRQPQKQQSYW